MSKRVHLILIHGFLGSGDDWKLMAQNYFQKFQCHFFTLPGHRFKPLVRDKPLLDTTLNELHALVTRLKKSGPVFIAGYSMGGRIALQYKARFPGFIGKLVILSANLGIDEDQLTTHFSQISSWQKALQASPFEAFIKAWYQTPLFSHLDLNETLLKKRLQNNPHDLAYVIEALATGNCPNLWSMPSSFFKNCLFFFGKEDIKYGQIAKKLAREKSAFVKCINGASHALLEECPKLCATFIGQFLIEEKVPV